MNPRKATVYIHGGETFLAPREHLAEVNRIVRRELRDTAVNIIPQTNLMYDVDESFVEFIHREYAGQMGVSWDYGIRFETGSKRFGEELFFGNLQKLIRGGVEVAVAITVQRHLLEANVEQLLEKFSGVSSLDFEFLTMFDEKTLDLKVSNDAWSAFYDKVVRYYATHEVSWSLPQVDLLTKSLMENKIYNCKCNCCQHRTFTLNCNETLGLCPDETYVRPLSNLEEFTRDWATFEAKAREQHLTHLAQELNPKCQSCEFFDICGGNCEASLFDESEECPLSRKTIRYQAEHLERFKEKLKFAMTNLVELKT